jgi:hypothetical protein
MVALRGRNFKSIFLPRTYHDNVTHSLNALDTVARVVDGSPPPEPLALCATVLSRVPYLSQKQFGRPSLFDRPTRERRLTPSLDPGFESAAHSPRLTPPTSGVVWKVLWFAETGQVCNEYGNACDSPSLRGVQLPCLNNELARAQR